MSIAASESSIISAVLLAAGQSRRMGEFKQLLPFAGKTFVECAVDSLLQARVDEVIVVTGHREADVRRSLGARRVRFAHNPNYQSGMSASIKCGIKAVNPNSRAVLLALVDQPQIEPAIINRILDAYEKDQPLIVVPTYDGLNGHPILLDLSLRDEILGMDPEQGLRQVVHAHSAETRRVEVTSDSVLKDCDYPEDYRRLQDFR